MKKFDKIFFTFVFVLIYSISIGQNTFDTTYFDRKWQKTNKEKYKYFRISKKDENIYHVTYYYKNGKVQMKATCISLDPEIKDGVCIWYRKNGNVKDSVKYSKYTSDEAENIRQYNMIDKAIDYSYKKKNIDSLQKVLDYGEITNPIIYSSSYSEKASILQFIYEDEINKFKDGDTSKVKIINQILDSYKIAIDTWGRCKLHRKVDRMNFLEEINDTGNLYENDLEELKAAGYKKDFTSLDFGIDLKKGKNNWIGGELNIINYNGARWKLNKNDSISNKYHIPYSLPFVLGFINISYSRNININEYDFALSLIQMRCPVFINVTKFGFQKSNEKKHWYYRPEVGIGWKWVSIYYSYNLMLKKSLRPISEKHLINLKILLPIISDK